MLSQQLVMLRRLTRGCPVVHACCRCQSQVPTARLREHGTVNHKRLIPLNKVSILQRFELHAGYQTAFAFSSFYVWCLSTFTFVVWQLGTGFGPVQCKYARYGGSDTSQLSREPGQVCFCPLSFQNFLQHLCMQSRYQCFHTAEVSCFAELHRHNIFYRVFLHSAGWCWSMPLPYYIELILA